MSNVNNTAVDPLAAAAKLLQRQAELEAEMKEVSKKIYQASKAAKTPAIERMKVTEKGMVSIYFNFQRWPVTLGKEALTLLVSDAVVNELKQHANNLPSYAERKELGLVAE